MKKSVLMVILLVTMTLVPAPGDSPGESPAEANSNELKTANIIQLTPAEETWLRNHRTIRLGISPVMPPLKFQEKGVIKGLEPDYINLLSEYSGMNFQLVTCEFKEMDTKLKSGEIDMFLSVYIPERLGHVTFTEPFMDFDQIIVTRIDAPFTSGIGSLKGKKIAVLKGLRLHEKILNPYKEIEIVRVDTMEQMFKAVSDSTADALISKTYLATYIMHRYPKLKIAGIADIPRDPYYYAVRKDYPELVEILNKAIKAIPRERLDSIVQKWFNVRVEYRPNWSEILRWAFGIGALFSLLLGLMLFWNRRLAREIDQRRLAEEELHERDGRLIDAQRMAQIGNWELVIQTNRLVWSDEIYRIFEIDPAQFGDSYEAFLDAIHPDDREFVDKTYTASVKNRTSYTVNHRLLMKSGNIKFVQERGETIYDDQGVPVRSVGTVQDITERKAAEESLNTYAERLKNLHRIDLAILQAIDSPEKITQEAILHVRDLLRCQRVSVGLFDFKKKEVRVFAAGGDTDSVVQTGQVLPEDLYGDLGILRENRLEIIEDTSNMETVPDILGTFQAEGVRSSINAPISSPKGLIGVLSIGWDTPRTITPEEQEITSEAASLIAIAIEQARLLQETKRHAEELEQRVAERTAQLETANKELEAFSYSVSHDLRAPLRHISGYVDLLNKRFREALPEKAEHYLNQVTDSASQMGTLIDDLLQFSRTGRQELRQADMDMNAAVQEALEKLKTDTKSRNISWSVAELPRVPGDYSLLQQVWINLLENAVKYTRYKDEARIEVGCTREPDQWVFFVRDNGVGFDMQYAHKLFGVFQRLHSPAQFEGTGIGLAHVQRIVQKHGGRVRAEGRPDEGATFYFTIPDNTIRQGGKS
jgi:signal transduction histidine kinase/ABC-type amino acid transport substrate-binding protein